MERQKYPNEQETISFISAPRDFVYHAVFFIYFTNEILTDIIVYY